MIDIEVKGFLGVLIALAILLWLAAWLVILPTTGALWLLGWLK
jgi:hypothetical protein